MRTGLLALLLGLVGLFGLGFGPIAELERSVGLRWLYGLRGASQPPGSVIVVAIDEQSSRELGLPDKPRAWPRRMHGELIRHLARSGARVIVFDMTFETASADPADDEALADAMAAAGNVLLAESIVVTEVPVNSLNGRAVGRAVIHGPVSTLPRLNQVASGSAPFVLPKADRVEQYWTFAPSSSERLTLPVLAFHWFAWDSFTQFGRAVGEKPGPPATVDSGPRQWLASEKGGRWIRAMRESPTTPHRESGDTPALRSFVRLYGGEDMAYLNFYGPPRTIPTLSYSRVLEAARRGDRDSVSFAGRAVFVGASPATQGGQERLRDDYRTVFSREDGFDISGVEIAATAFANLTEDRSLQRVSPGFAIAALFAFATVLSGLCAMRRPLHAAFAIAVGTAAYAGVAHLGFSRAGLWLPLFVPVAAQAPVALLARVCLAYRDARSEREALKQAFNCFLPSSMVDRLARNAGPVTGANRVVYGACLSTDVDKYTALAEQIDPGQLAALMNRYFSEVFVPVEHSRGVVVDIVGDAIIAIWADGSSGTEMRRNACAGALEIVEALKRFNDPATGQPVLSTRFGLHAGDMMVGSIGGSGHYEYRAVGDIVNTASRIQSLNKVLGTRLLVSQETMAGLSDFAVRPLGEFLLPGKANAVRVGELLGKQSELSAHAETAMRRFAAGLRAFAERRWQEAGDSMRALLANDPDDGAARFYAEHCDRLARDEPDSDWTPTMRVDIK